jgi:hypothetical protein
MKAKGKRAGIRSERKRNAVVVAIFLGFVMLVSAFYLLRSQSQNQTANPAYSRLRAAIVDQLSLTFPNQTFIQTTTSNLEQANYTVDYYSGSQVTVSFFGSLATRGYSLIILREHSTALEEQGQNFVSSPVFLFTNENYSGTAYLYEQLTDQLGRGSYAMPNPPYYFAIAPGFVTSSMSGRFQNTTIIMMSCQSMNNPTMAEALVQKGATACIGWNKSVSADRTDQATLYLLQHLITQKETIKQAVNDTMTQVGTDPQDKSLLAYYPPEAGEQTTDNTNGKSQNSP